MPWHQKCDKALPVLILTQFNNVQIRHKVSFIIISLCNIKNSQSNQLIIIFFNIILVIHRIVFDIIGNTALTLNNYIKCAPCFNTL